MTSPVTSAEIRSSFCRYFVERGHTPVPSSPLIPPGDPTLLFTNAGMVQFKGVFLGEEKRGYTRAVTVQKCLRAGGKHNDLENVGVTARHHTFFEMMGNFSFGDYFKEDAIAMGWEFLTRDLSLPADRLWVTVYRGDEKAYDIWHKKIGVKSDRVIRMGERDNFWQMGETGPCGPCSEIIIDQGPQLGCGRPTCGVGCDCDRYLELWNLVFMENEKNSRGELRPLPRPSIDTGMGLERISAVCQGVTSNYDTDLFRPLLAALSELSGIPRGKEKNKDISCRVIADHLRAIVFLIAEGVLPSNEGRGYVLRRIMRRAARHGRLLEIEGPFLYRLVGVVIDLMSEAYPDLSLTRNRGARVTMGEEERFLNTLTQGMVILEEIIEKVRRRNEQAIPGADLFRLYDTYGFPLDLVSETAREAGLSLDETGFEKEMEGQRTRARRSWTGYEIAKEKSIYTDLLGMRGSTTFIGYTDLEAEVEVAAILKGDTWVAEASEGEEVSLLFPVTPFYGEGGGQVGDQGALLSPRCRVEISDTIRPLPDLIIHRGKVTQGRLREGERYQAAVNRISRQATARNHTATHLLHSTLREILGDHVKQSGSLVAPDRLRLDFSHFSPMTPRELDRIEEVVNEKIRENHSVEAVVMGLDEALATGALALFGEKYRERVRVVRIVDYSKELCGGTHCQTTGEVGLFTLVHEGSIASGVRRVEALTGEAAYHLIKGQERELAELARLVKSHPRDLVSKTQRLIATLKEKEKEVERLRKEISTHAMTDIDTQGRVMSGIRVVTARLDALDATGLRGYADSVRERIKSGIIVLGSGKGEKSSLLVVVTPDLSGKFHAGEIIKEITAAAGGTGGGKAEMAQGGGGSPERLDAALKAAYESVEKRVKGQR